MLASQFFGPPGAPRCNRAVRIRRLSPSSRPRIAVTGDSPPRGISTCRGIALKHEPEAVLRDGSRIHLRPIRPDYATRSLYLYHRLLSRSLYHRFFIIPRPDLSQRTESGI